MKDGLLAVALLDLRGGARGGPTHGRFACRAVYVPRTKVEDGTRARCGGEIVDPRLVSRGKAIIL